MYELTEDELKLVAGGDAWAGTPEGRAPYTSPFTECMNESVTWSQGRAEWAGLYCGGRAIYRWFNDLN